LLINILSDKGMKKIDENFNYAVVFNAVKNGVGFFKPPSIGDTLRNQLINRFNVPSEIVIELETKLAKLAGSAIPLLEIKEKSEEE